jgi:hypothetical protein
VRLVEKLRQLIAVFVLLAWLGASVHVALDHGGESFHASHACGDHDHQHDHDHHHAPAQEGGGDHHHDLRVATPAQFAKLAEKQALLPQWVPLYDRLAAELAALLRGTEALHEHSMFGESPPDTRMSGWLFVVQTARPVRGPSLAV